MGGAMQVADQHMSPGAAASLFKVNLPVPAPTVSEPVHMPASTLFQHYSAPTVSSHQVPVDIGIAMPAAFLPQCVVPIPPVTPLPCVQSPAEVESPATSTLQTIHDGMPADDIRLVSLGSYCGPKHAFRKIGRDRETLPFDWLYTRIQGLLHFLRNDFHGFFGYQVVERTPHDVSVYKSYTHSFWHDNPNDPEDQAKYMRRFARFNSIDANSKPVLFVRSVQSTEELQYIEELLDELSRFGKVAKLLVLVDRQPQRRLVHVAEHPNLLIALLSDDVSCGDFGTSQNCRAIEQGIAWAKGHAHIDAMTMPSVSAVAALVTETLHDSHFA